MLFVPSFISYRTGQYKLHYYETLTNIKFVMLTDISTPNMRNVLHQIYVNLYVEFGMFFPFTPEFKPQCTRRHRHFHPYGKSYPYIPHQIDKSAESDTKILMSVAISCQESAIPCWASRWWRCSQRVIRVGTRSVRQRRLMMRHCKNRIVLYKQDDDVLTQESHTAELLLTRRSREEIYCGSLVLLLRSLQHIPA